MDRKIPFPISIGDNQRTSIVPFPNFPSVVYVCVPWFISIRTPIYWLHTERDSRSRPRGRLRISRRDASETFPKILSARLAHSWLLQPSFLDPIERSPISDNSVQCLDLTCGIFAACVEWNVYKCNRKHRVFLRNVVESDDTKDIYIILLYLLDPVNSI